MRSVVLLEALLFLVMGTAKSAGPGDGGGDSRHTELFMYPVYVCVCVMLSSFFPLLLS